MKRWISPGLTLLLLLASPVLLLGAGDATAGKASYAKKCAGGIAPSSSPARAAPAKT